MYRFLIRPILFLFDAERVHHATTRIASWVWRFREGRAATRLIVRGRAPLIRASLAGIELSSPIGLAAGFDKNAELTGVANLGFGFLEVGTVTPKAQEGNPRPRLSRIPEKKAILNRMGFNNEGAKAVAARLRLQAGACGVPIGVNLGKNKHTPNERSVEDYEILFREFRSIASYFVVNISSPNTPGLRDLQSGSFARELAQAVAKLRLGQPVLIKLASEIDPDSLKEICSLCHGMQATGAELSQSPFSGLVLTNTLATDLGGLSGAPLKGPSTKTLRLARTMLPQDATVISVGGIETVDDIVERFRLGADAVQIYTALIYQGPRLVGQLLRGLEQRMRHLGVRSLAEIRER